jgi:hypothetical protein
MLTHSTVPEWYEYELVVRIIVSGSLMHAGPPGDLLKAVAEFSWR